MRMSGKHILGGITYRGKVVDFIPGYTLYNFGTETFIGQRSKQHQRELRKDNLNYKILSENADRTFNTKTIKASADSLYINRLKENLIYKTNNNSIKTLVECPRISSNGLSPTECLLIPNDIFDSPLFEESIKEADRWYYTDKSIREANKYSNANIENYRNLTPGEKLNACQPLTYSFHNSCFEFLKTLSLKERNNVKNIIVQSLSLASDHRLYRLFPSLGNITVLVVADDVEKNEELYKKMKSDKLYNIIDLDSDAEVEDYYMNGCKGFDLIIGNPPYNNTLHSTILNTVVENNPNAVIVWLAPDNLIFGKQSANKKSRELLKDRFSGWKHIGNQFGENKIVTPISIYYFAFNHTLKWGSVEGDLNSLTLPSYKSIMQKIKNAPKINRVNRNAGQCNFRIYDRKKHTGDNRTLLYEFLNGWTIPSIACIIWDTGALWRSQIASSGNLENEKAGRDGWYCEFSSEKECKEQMNKLNDPRYKWVLKVISPNNRSLLHRPEELPESFDACNFTEEEIKELKDYYEKKD